MATLNLKILMMKEMIKQLWQYENSVIENLNHFGFPKCNDLIMFMKWKI